LRVLSKAWDSPQSLCRGLRISSKKLPGALDSHDEDLRSENIVVRIVCM